MAGRQGENTTHGYDFQQYSLLYLIEYLMRYEDRFPGFEIGSGIKGYGALDDIVLNVTLPDSSVVTNLFQVKHANSAKIHEHYLLYHDNTSVSKYFDTFLKLIRRKENPILLEQLGQLIIWTNMQFASDVKHWLEPYDPTGRDVLGDSANLKYERFQFKKDQFDTISFIFHPRMKLVYEIVDVLYKQKTWDPKTAAKSYYLEMAKQIIDDNGMFKQEFIAEQKELSEEAIRFQQCFKPEFSMEKLNSEYRDHLELYFDTNVKVRWKKWKNQPGDLEEFRKRFVFYVNVPKVDDLQKCLMMQAKYSFIQVRELLKTCANGNIINKKQLESLFSLLKLRASRDSKLGPYAELWFNDKNYPLITKVKKFLTDENSGTCLHVQAVQDVDCTLSRLIPSVKDYLAPLNERYLVLTCNNFDNNWPDLQKILEVESLVENGLKCIIIAAVPKDKAQEIETKLSPSKVKAILVGDQLESIFVDDFDISTLHQECKDKINNMQICLSESQEANAFKIFGDKLFQKENYRLALKLFKRQKPIRLNGNKFQLDEHFRERKLMEENESVLDLMRTHTYQQIVVSDQAGMGKSTELINIAVEMQKYHQDHLIVYLDCKDAVKHHDKKEDIADIVCHMTNTKGETEKVVVQKIIELGKMILLVDGIDEVSDSCETNLKALLITISKTKLFKLVIATRPHCSDLIQEILTSCIICQLKPFSESDQLEYLKSFWKVNELADENDRTRIVENTKQLIKQFRYVLKDCSFIGIPLQTNMIAVIYKTSIMSKDWELPMQDKIGILYQQFVEMKFNESVRRQYDSTSKAHESAIGHLKKKFIQNHSILAYKIFRNEPESELNQLGYHLETYGLVRLHPSVGFVHYTYYEFFLSLFVSGKMNCGLDRFSFFIQPRNQIRLQESAMASRKGDNTTDRFDFQHYSLLYLIEYLKRRKDQFLGFEIGSCIAGYGALNDIVLNVTLPDSSKVINLLHVKHAHYAKIHETYLCYNGKTFVYKYFDTFLDLIRRKENPILLDQLGQLIIWTNMQFASDVKDWFEEYVPTERDVLGANLPFQRFRFKEDKYNKISFLFHPRMKLAYEIVDVLYNIKTWDPKTAAKSYYLEMAKQIIDENGMFKQEFIAGQKGLSEEAIRFQQCFKAAMEKKFIREKIKPEFSMEKLNSKYWEHLELNFDTNVQVRWKKWKNEANDLEEFRKRFVFYVNLPKVDDLKVCLMKQANYSFFQVSELLKTCVHEKMINKKKFDSLISLIKLRQCMDIGPYAELEFDDPNDPLPTIVKNVLTQVNRGTCLHVKAIQDVYCTVSRLIPSVKDYLTPLNEKYLVLSCANFYKYWPDLQKILEVESLVKNGLKCIIIAAVPKDKAQEIETKLSPSGVNAILVGDQLESIFVDDFDISTLHQECKDKINNRIICLSESQEANVYEIFGDKLFQKENYGFALKLFLCQNTIHLNGNEFQLDEHFIERKLMKENEGVLDLMHTDEYQQIVISDDAGMGKTTELINIAVEMQKSHQDHLVVYLDCKTAVKLHDMKEDIAYIVCQMTNNRRVPGQIVVQQIIEQEKMILLVDGIDEVNDSCQTNLKALLNTISKTKLFKLVIATRPHCIKLIQEIFHSCIICNLEPFSESDQLEYLKSFWKVNELSDENDRTRIEENSKQLIKQFRSVLRDGSFIGIPLQTYMIAVIYKNTILSTVWELAIPYEIDYIYKQFFEMKFTESIQRHFDLTYETHESTIRSMKQNFIQDHVLLAYKIFKNAPESELNQLCHQLKPYGLVRLHPSVGFVHYSYFQYFKSLYVP